MRELDQSTSHQPPPSTHRQWVHGHFSALTNSQNRRHVRTARWTHTATRTGPMVSAASPPSTSNCRTTRCPYVLVPANRSTCVSLALLGGLGPRQEFRLLVVLLGVADQRRRTRCCDNGCDHAWPHPGTGEGTEAATT
ncbi:DUF5958 family protein [Streptomyces olivaceoviridis]|uniref:DUF5958 family protein n=2 Tax=Streptomyces olivaceoviridis TaxID=1921 RepID=UPI0033BAC9D6